MVVGLKGLRLRVESLRGLNTPRDWDKVLGPTIL